MDSVEIGPTDSLSPAKYRQLSDEPLLRVVRVARIAAEQNSGIAENVYSSIREDAACAVRDNEERLGDELCYALSRAENPRLFFDTLSEVNALVKTYPELAALRYVPAGPTRYHKEGCSYEHSMRVLMSMYEQRGNEVKSLLAALAHDLGKAATSPDILPNHYGHEKRGADLAVEMGGRLNLPQEYIKSMQTAARVHMQLNKFDQVNTTTVLDYAARVDDSPLSVQQVVALGAADAAGREPQGEYERDRTMTYLETAINVIGNVGEEDALLKRGHDPGGEIDIPEERIPNLVRQDRAEELRASLPF